MRPILSRRARNMITEFSLESIRAQIRPAIRTPDKSPRREVAGTHAEDVGPQVELTAEHPARSLATGETIEMPEPVHRGSADDQLIIEPAHPSRSDGYPDPQLPSPATIPAHVSDDASDLDIDRLLPRRQDTSPVPPRPTAVQRQAPAGAPAILPRGSGFPFDRLTALSNVEGQPESISPRAAMIRTHPHPSQSDGYPTPFTPDNLSARRPKDSEDSPGVRALARTTGAERAPVSGALSPTPQVRRPAASSPDNLSALLMADTAVRGAAGRMSAKQRRELAQIESAVQLSRQRELRLDSGR